MTAKILFVDDELVDPQNQRAYLQRLKPEIRAKLIEVYFATNGKEALEQLEKVPDLNVVLTDINMPVMNGMQLLAEIKNLNRLIKTVIISAYSEMDNIRQAMNLGAFDFLIKPINFDTAKLVITRTIMAVEELRQNQQKLEQAYASLEYEAMYDRLTDLPNRLAFTNYLVKQIEAAQQNTHLSYALLFIELQRLNVVNDTFGFLAVDHLIAQAAERLKICQQEYAYADMLDDLPNNLSVLTGFEGLDANFSDFGDFSDFETDLEQQANQSMLARFGGNSFVMLLSGLADPSRLTPIVKNIQQQISQPFEVNGYAQFISATIGIRRLSNLNSQPDTLEHVLQDVNTATYYAKRNKRSYEVFTPAMQDAARSRWQLESDLRMAIERQEFRVFYQPLMRLSDLKLMGFEALVRWQHPIRGLISPGIFIELAEETELIREIGGMVLMQACQQGSAWQDQFPELKGLCMSVNVSPLQCQDGLLLDQVSQAITQTMLPGTNLKLEITESSFTDVEASRQMWDEITAMGVSLSIDDFGTGYSCLSRLHELPISTLKIDQSFVRNMSKGEEHLEVINTILSLAKSLSMGVVAEGIETSEQQTRLQVMGCGWGQGYYFAKPMDGDRATAYIAGHRAQVPAMLA